MNLRLNQILLVLMAIPLLIFSSCKPDEKQPEDDVTPHTLIYYFTGTSLSLHFYNNISAAEVAVRKNVLQNSRIVCFFQSSDKRSAEVIELVYNNGACERKTLATYELPAIMDAERLTYNLKEIMALAPAESYGLVMAGHATGWVPIDGVAQSSATISGGKPAKRPYISHEELWKKQDTGVETRFFGEKYSSTAANAFDIPDLAKAFSDTGVYFDYILFDACLMANVEALYDLRRAARYIIASPCEIMAAGFPYTDVVPLLMKDGGRSHDLAGVCLAYNKYYENSKSYRSGSVALVDCSQLDALATAVKKVNNAQQKSYDLDNIQSFEGHNDHIFFDLGDYIEQMCDDEQALKAFQQQMNRTIPTKYTLSVFWTNLGVAGEYPIKSFSGLTTSAPSILYRSDYENTAWHKATH